MTSRGSVRFVVSFGRGVGNGRVRRVFASFRFCQLGLSFEFPAFRRWRSPVARLAGLGARNPENEGKNCLLRSSEQENTGYFRVICVVLLTLAAKPLSFLAVS